MNTMFVTQLLFVHIYQPIQGYPDEWFPSVSATIGDRYPERSVFMLFIALTSGTIHVIESLS